jgi:ABC-type multidrug transport system fused ATPase/permease subunit
MRLYSFTYCVSECAPNIWLSDWTKDANGDNPSQKEYRLGVFAGLSLLQSLISLSNFKKNHLESPFMSKIFFFFKVCNSFFIHMWLNGAKILHSKMLISMLKSTMAFFESTPSGRILNLFSRDIETIERAIPDSLRKFLIYFFQIVSTLVIITVATPLFLVGLFPIAFIYLYVRRYFVASLRQLKRMDSVSKSPILSHFSESLTGLSTIRAYKVENRFRQEMEQKIDENLMFYFPNNIANRWLSLRLDLIKNLIVLLAGLFAVLYRDSISTSAAALSITYSLNVSIF